MAETSLRLLSQSSKANDEPETTTIFVAKARHENNTEIPAATNDSSLPNRSNLNASLPPEDQTNVANHLGSNFAL